MRCSIVLLSTWMAAGLTVTSHHSAVAAEGDLSFNRDIRPVLSATCFQCHGPDKKHRKADLRLDEEEGIEQAFGETELEDNEAWQRMTSTNPKKKMPPPKSHLTVKPEDLELIKKWIQQGAKYEGHWSFVTPTQPAVPKVKQQTWIKNPIDAFVLKRLEDKGLAPNNEAARERLLRRVTFDLTGLPPTLKEIDAFLADTSPNAYEKAVDRLLANEHFGERLAVAWLDAARYGDTSVFHADGPRDMWAWRDWVIRSYNKNKSFKDFTIEQLAGDLLPSPSVEQQIATAFNRNNASTDEGGVIPEEFRVEYAVDRVKTTSMVWMGLTMECAQCHSHKFDPISQKEYYEFYAYFNQASDPGMQRRQGNQAPTVNVPDLAIAGKTADIRKQLDEANKKLADRKTAGQAEFDQWLTTIRAEAGKQTPTPGGMILHLPLDKGNGKEVVNAVKPDQKGKFEGQVAWTDGNIGKALSFNRKGIVNLGKVGDFDRSDTFSYGAWIKPDGGRSGAAIARMQTGNNYRGYDLYISGGTVSVHLVNVWPTNAIKVTTNAQLKANHWQHVFVTYDGPSKAAGIKIYFDGKEQPWKIEQDRLDATIRTGIATFLGRRKGDSPYGGQLDDVRIYPRELVPSEVSALAGSNPVAGLLAAADKGDAKKKAELRDYYFANFDKPTVQINKQITGIRKQLDAANRTKTTVMVMKDVAKPRQTFMLMRGQYDQPDKKQPVEPGVPAFLPELQEDAPKNRLTMARWLFDPEHPLTSRVTVNRYWHMLFGTGIVKTVEDFGSQGATPSHPALLDWLAVDFQENGWDIKRTIKQMVMSNTYRQSSRVDAKKLAVDSENRLLSRGTRYRLQGEFVRDNALAVSGLLVPTIGGPSVKPYQPPGLWNEVSIQANLRFVQDKGEKLYRRSMYIYWKRSAPPPSMSLFGAPARDKCIMRRSRTNTPMQALVTLNDVQFVEAARALAERSIHEGGDTPEKQIAYAYRLTTGVAPKPAMLKLLADSYGEEFKVFQAAPDRAKQFLAIGESKRDETIDAAEHAALTIVTSMILNLDETLTRG